MKVLFIIRGKEGTAGVPFIVSQMQSLTDSGVETDVYRLYGKGLLIYFTRALSLRRHIQNNHYDILHAHYGLCGLTALLAGTGKPIVVSMMGSDVLGEFVRQNKTSLRSIVVVVLGWFVQIFADRLIAKSPNIFAKLLIKRKARIIPNGVDLDFFRPSPKEQAKASLGLDSVKYHVLVLANPAHPWKNVPLAQAALKKMNDPRVELLIPFPLEPSRVTTYLNAADVFVHPSFMEGSSNVLKEAMACNCPMVATAVGDAAWLLGNTDGCCLSGFTVDEMIDKVKEALDFAIHKNRTKGRERIEELGLSLKQTAIKIVEVYKEVISKK
jgi:glycosyltransferase involved in cell wall biosynthesis